MIQFENILVYQNTKCHQEYNNILNNMNKDSNINKLHAQLIMLPSIARTITSISKVINYLSNKYLTVKVCNLKMTVVYL